MDYITTVSGIKFTPLQPEPGDILIGDIAHALSLLCRANGHFPEFFSVAQHSLNCADEAAARGHSRRVRLACLLHDASEAYLSDITRPVKRNLPRYREIERVVQDAIYARFLTDPLSEGELRRVDQIDDAQLYYEFRHFRKEWEFQEVPRLMGSPDYRHPGFAEIERRFLECFSRLSVLE